MDGYPETDSTHERVVEQATGAIADLDDAATFRRDGGLARLRRAIAAAERVGDHHLVRRGQRVLAAYEWFDRAVRSIGSTERRPGQSTGRSPSKAENRTRERCSRNG